MNRQYKNFGDFLHQKRIAKGDSYRDLAAVLGVSAPYISDIEKDRRNAPSMEKLEKLSEYFGLTADEKALMFDLAPNELPQSSHFEWKGNKRYRRAIHNRLFS